MRLHFNSDGTLGAEPDADGGTVGYAYLPGVGTQARGGYKLTGQLPDQTKGSWSETPPEGTYATFETPALESDKLFAGPGSVDLMVSSTQPDTDFQVTLTEVRSDGQEVFVQQGWLRASHRKLDAELSNPLRPYQTHLTTDVQPLVPGQATPMSIEIFPFAHAFRDGLEDPHLHRGAARPARLVGIRIAPQRRLEHDPHHRILDSAAATGWR